MLPYWLTFFIFAFGSLSRPFQTDRRLGPVLGAALVALTLFVGLRYNVGADWRIYYSMYTRAALLDWGRLMVYGDRGFYTVAWALSHGDIGFWSLNLVCAVIFMVGLTAFAKRTPNPWLTISVALPYLIIVVAMSAIRQAAAIGLFYLAINAYQDRRLFLAAVWVLLGATFHASAIIMLGVFGFAFSRNRFQGALIIGVTAYIATYVLSANFDTYNTRYGQHAVESSGTIYRILMNIAAALPYLFLRKHFPVAADHERKLWSYLSWLSLACLPALAVVNSSTALDRFALYLFPLQTYVLGWIPVVLTRNGGNVRNWTILLLAYLAIVLFVFLNFAVNASSSIPYRFYPFFGE